LRGGTAGSSTDSGSTTPPDRAQRRSPRRASATSASCWCATRFPGSTSAAITNASGRGEDILLLAAFVGHAKTSTSVDTYSHLLYSHVLPKRAQEAARRMRSLSAPGPHQVPR
jgi:hypothetical protein